MFSMEMTIARPVREVFANLARVENAPLWYSAVTSVHRFGDGPVGVGTRFLFRRKLGSGETVNDVEVTAFEPDRILELSSVSGPTPFVYRYELRPSAGGHGPATQGPDLRGRPDRAGRPVQAVGRTVLPSRHGGKPENLEAPGRGATRLRVLWRQVARRRFDLTHSPADPGLVVHAASIADGKQESGSLQQPGCRQAGLIPYLLRNPQLIKVKSTSILSV